MTDPKSSIDVDEVQTALQGAAELASSSREHSGVASARLGGGEVLPEVQYRLLVEGSASGWQVRHVAIREAISELYELSLDIAHVDLSTDPDEFLERRCELEIARGALVERRYGEVRRVTRTGTTSACRLARITVVPALHRLTQTTDSRIFQDLTALEVVTAVLRDHQVYARTFTLEVQRECPTREYCVQYKESDLAFVMRLMAEEGIAFHFRHDAGGDGEHLVLTDHARRLLPVPTLDGGPVPVAGPESATLHVESVRFFDSSCETRSTGAVLRDFDWTRPEFDLTGATPPDGGPRTVYEYPAELTLNAYKSASYTHDDRVAQSQLRHEAHVATARTAVARTNLIGARPGALLEITGHGDDGHDGHYLVLRVEHTGVVPDVTLVATQHDSDDHDRYRNEVVCVPVKVPYRPARETLRPRVSGVQTAKVVGPPGQEVYTDEHGRVKVRFHWDRADGRERSSCWIRVMQSWAGAGWGAFFLPRVGMEVVVDFLEGNPDRPLVIGCVYNGMNRPPYEFPADQTRSTLKTRSSPGGNGYNELRFEDLAGEEEISLHAQKDLNEVVGNNHTTIVHANQTTTVEQNVTVRIKGSRSVIIDGAVQGDGHPVKGAALTVTGQYKVDVSDTIEVQAPTCIELTCGRSSILIEPDRITMSAGGGARIVLDANAKLTSNAESQVLLDDKATMASSGGSEVMLAADALIHASGGGAVELTADAVMSGSEATVRADGKATVTGVEADVQGSSAVNISGGVVAIN